MSESPGPTVKKFRLRFQPTIRQVLERKDAELEYVLRLIQEEWQKKAKARGSG
jgi:hypothetical protein